ncbi:MAG: hypothetical protein ISR65_06285 [Bacteriovoracaceae bacterium]|nr:hypothetical protein [Bacteriovoracaceae bacterium]
MKLLMGLCRAVNAVRGGAFYLFMVLSAFIPWIKNRLKFEGNNLADPNSRSFKSSNEEAFIAFEVASEGELEQVAQLLERFLLLGKKVELIYSSGSVQQKCDQWANKFSQNLRVFRLPLLSYSFFSGVLKGQNLKTWITAKRLVLCRYDFYPELLLYGASPDVSFYLLSATLKNKESSYRNNNFVKRWYYNSLYNLFEIIVPSSSEDIERFKQLGVSSASVKNNFDLRTVQILKRLDNSQAKLKEITFFKHFENSLKHIPPKRRIMLGSMYPQEMEIFDNPNFQDRIKSGDLFVTVAPHKLKPAFVGALISTVGHMVPVYLVSDNMEDSELDGIFKKMSQVPGLLIIAVPGILCELYQFYGHIFVGGGHAGVAIHSVLEPFLAGGMIYCGPKIHRSTEYDLIKQKSSDSISVIDNLNRFYEIYVRQVDISSIQPRQIVEELKQTMSSDFDKVFAFLNTGHLC